MKQEISDKNRVFYMKILVLVYGAICLLLAFLAQYFDSILQTSLTILGVIGGPVLAVFTLGVLIPRIDQKVFYLLLVKKQIIKYYFIILEFIIWSITWLSIFIYNWIWWTKTSN